MAQKLANSDLKQSIEKLDSWVKLEERDAIYRSFKFANFNEAFSFMTRIAMKAEQLDHHPEWRNVYSTVEVTLTTHSANGITELDIELAKFMNEIV